MRRHRQAPSRLQPLRRAEQHLVGGRAARLAAEHEDLAVRKRDRRRLRQRLRQRPDPRHLHERLARGLHVTGNGREQVEAVGLVQIPRRTARATKVPVGPDDLLRARVHDENAVVPVVGERDHPVRPAHRERRTVQRPLSRGLPRPDDLPAGRDLVHATRRVEAGDEDVPVRQQLRVGRVRRGGAHGVEDLPARADAVDPAADLGHEHAAVRERRVAVRRAQRVRRIVRAVAGVSDTAHDVFRAVHPQHAAVDDVGDLHEPVRQQVRVIGIREIAGRGSAHVRMPVRPFDAVRARADQRDRLVVLLVRRDRLVPGREERVVRIVQPFDPPDDLLRGRDEDDPVVVAVDNHHVAGDRPGGDRRQPELLRRRRRHRRRQCQEKSSEHADRILPRTMNTWP